MNFVQQLEECLRDLAAEARKKHPGVKEASERATLKLRQLKNSYVSAVRRANANTSSSSSSSKSSSTTTTTTTVQEEHPTTRLFQSSEILHPFLLAANYPNASNRLLEISFRAMRLLLEADAILPSDAIHLERVWMIQAQVVVTYYQVFYSKELASQQAQLETQRAQAAAAAASVSSASNSTRKSTQKNSDTNDDGEAVVAESTGTTVATSSGSSSSGGWFSWVPSYASSSSSPSSVATNTGAASSSTMKSSSTTTKAASSSSKTTEVATTTAMTTKAVKNAVSSSTGQTGSSQSSPKEMEKRALEILSCLLQLLECLRRCDDYDDSNASSSSSSTELWTNSMALGCVWFSHALPARHTVLQAAYSTVSQILTLLFQQASNSSNNKLCRQTWEDLLVLALPPSSSTSSSGRGVKLTGAFSLCKVESFPSTTTMTTGAASSSKSSSSSKSTSGGSVSAVAPHPTLATELLVRLWRDQQQQSNNSTDDGSSTSRPVAISLLPDTVQTRTFHVTAQLLDQTKTCTVERAHRILQWTTLLLQAQCHANSINDNSSSSSSLLAPHPQESREILGRHLVQPTIALATEACRGHHDFEDGYIYSIYVSTTEASMDTSSAAVWSESEMTLLMREQSSQGSLVQQQQQSSPSSSSSQSGNGGAGSSGGNNIGFIFASYFPAPILWKAGLALESIYRILEKDPIDFMAVLLGDRRTIGALTETLSDFATIGASCRDHMLQLVDYCQRSASTNYTHLLSSAEAASARLSTSTMDPTLVRKVDQVIAAGTTAAVFSTESSSFSSSHDRRHSSGASSSSPATSSSSPSTSFVLGEALWIALQGILRIIESLPFAPPDVADDLLEETFVPALAVLQHYLKRFVGSDYLVELSLRGYASLAQTCLTRTPALPVFQTKNAMQRKALLTSLCKLSVPFWGKHDASCQLQDHHLRCLLCLIRILHSHHDRIQSEWEVILWTFEDLSILAIASPLLSDQAYHSALAVSTVFQRFAAFSTCFSTASLLAMVQALTEIVKVSMEDRDVLGDSDTVLPERVTATMDASSDSRSGGSGGESISKQIMNMGVRVIYGQQSQLSGDSDKNHTSEGSASAAEKAAAEQRTRNTFYEDYRRDFIQRISKAESTVRIASIGRLPFALALLADVAMANSFRYAECGERMTGLLSQLAASSPPVRPFVMDTIALVTMSHISDRSDSAGESSSSSSPAAPFVGPGKVVFVNPMQSQLLAVEPAQRRDNAVGKHAGSEQLDKRRSIVPQADLLAPLCESIKTTEKADVAEAALGTLHAVLESAGHNLTGCVWIIVIDAITSLSGDPCYSLDRSLPKWSKCCLNAFRCLKLIVDDFLDQLPTTNPITASNDENTDASDKEGTTARIALLDCCSSFGSSRHDVNTSLTAIGLLWTLADQDAGTNSTDRALSKLVFLASDSRPEVRNAAVNTLFSCIVGKGSTFSAVRWESCIVETIFAIYQNVSSRANGEEDDDGKDTSREEVAAGSTPSRYRVNLHHTRDNANKQWFATQVVVLRGLSRVLRNFFPQLLDTTDKPRDDSTVVQKGNDKSSNGDDEEVPWFQDAWVQILDFAYEAAAQSGERETLDMRSIGVELLVLCCQLSSRAGIQAAPARVGTNMQVINGALRSVGESKVSMKESYKRTHSTVTEIARANLYLEAFESLESYQEFLEKAAEDGGRLDDTQLQMLHKFCDGLTQLYDSCKDNELSTNNRVRSLALLSSFVNGTTPEVAEEELDRRFVAMVATVIRLSTVDASARFLNQAQRSSLGLLKLMCSDGYCESYRGLVAFAGKAFYVRTESEKDDTESGECVEVQDLVGLEASVAVSKGIASENVSDECRMFVLYQVLSILSCVAASNDKQANNRPYYKRILQIVTCGLDAASTLEKVADDETKEGRQAKLLIDAVWEKFCSSLSRMMAPVPIHKSMTKISRVSDLLEIVETATGRASNQHAQQLCAVLVMSARECLQVARLHEDYAEEHSNDIAPKSKKHRDEVLKLFAACFTGGCALQPEDEVLKSISKQVLGNAVSSQRPSTMTVDIEASLLICNAITESEQMESLVISIFHLLCQLIASDDSKLRQAVNRVFVAVNVSALLQTAHARYGAAERRAKESEEQVQSLTLAVRDLQLENERLERDIAILEASTGL